MANSGAPLESVNPRLAEILRIASELRDLPSADFKQRLRAKLVGQPADVAVASKPLVTYQDIMERMEQMPREPRLVPHDLRAAMRNLPSMTMRFFDRLDGWILITSGGTKRSHWERHQGDEMLYVVEGAADIEVLTDDCAVTTSVSAGSLFVCPEGLWHRVNPRPSMRGLYLTPAETEGSSAKDPRQTGKRTKRGAPSRSRVEPKPFPAWDLKAELAKVPFLAITAATTGEQADEASNQFARMNNLSLGVMSYSGGTPWERHACDELLFAIDGELELEVITREGVPAHRTLTAGAVFVCPQGLWHRQYAPKSVAMLYGTAVETTEHSFDDVPPPVR